MSKNCRNVNKRNHFAKMCRSQQVNEIIKNSTSSEDEEGNVIQSFDSCDDFEFLSIKYDFISIAQIEKYVENRIEIKQAKPSSVTENSYVKNGNCFFFKFLIHCPQLKSSKNRWITQFLYKIK